MANKQVTVATIKEMKQKGEPITMITAYDVAMSRNVNEAGVDMILVGDSLGNVILGYNSTGPVTMDEMIHHTKAVMRGNSTALVVGDMPFMSFNVSIEDIETLAYPVLRHRIKINYTAINEHLSVDVVIGLLISETKRYCK